MSGYKPMNSTNSFKCISRRLAWALPAIASIMIASVAASPTVANAGKPRPPKPTPTPVAAPPVPSNFRVKWSEAMGVVVTVDPFAVEGQIVSGPGGSVFGYSDPHAGILIQNLTPNSDYTVRFRSYAFTASFQQVFSDYATFTFHTPTIEQSRPSAPVISFAAIDPGSLDVSWPPSTDNSVGVQASAAYVRYVYSINGGAQQSVCDGGYCNGGDCPDSEKLEPQLTGKVHEGIGPRRQCSDCSQFEKSVSKIDR
jgi:hypothetical protein